MGGGGGVASKTNSRETREIIFLQNRKLSSLGAHRFN